MNPIKESVQVTFNQVLKSPSTYMLMVAVSILWFFVMKFGNVSDRVNINCELEKKQLREELAEERNKTEVMVNALLVKNGIIDAFVKAADSLEINVGNQSKKIVIKNKK